jgi:hypothetical protein
VSLGDHLDALRAPQHVSHLGVMGKGQGSRAGCLRAPPAAALTNLPSLTRWFFFVWCWARFQKSAYIPRYIVQARKKTCYLLNSRVSLLYLGWLMGLEPTTTGITILDSTN